MIPSGEVGGTLTFLSDLSGPFVSGAPSVNQLCWESAGLTGPLGTFVVSIQLGADRVSHPLGSTFSSCLGGSGSGMGIPFASTDTAIDRGTVTTSTSIVSPTR